MEQLIAHDFANKKHYKDQDSVQLDRDLFEIKKNIIIQWKKREQ